MDSGYLHGIGRRYAAVPAGGGGGKWYSCSSADVALWWL